MKRFILFSFDSYYPCGGWHDFVGSYDTLDEARERAKTVHCEHWQIVDTKTEVVVDGTVSRI